MVNGREENEDETPIIARLPTITIRKLRDQLVPFEFELLLTYTLDATGS